MLTRENFSLAYQWSYIMSQSSDSSVFVDPVGDAYWAPLRAADAAHRAWVEAKDAYYRAYAAKVEAGWAADAFLERTSLWPTKGALK
jgi:hypothetical protein